MFVGGYVSEHETTSVIVEHENIGTIRVFCLPGEDLLSFLLSRWK